MDRDIIIVIARFAAPTAEKPRIALTTIMAIAPSAATTIRIIPLPNRIPIRIPTTAADA